MIVIIQCKTDTMDLPFQTERARSTRVKFIAPSLRGEARRPMQAKNEFVSRLRSGEVVAGVKHAKSLIASPPRLLYSSNTKQTPQNTFHRTRTQGKQQLFSWVT
jgi:hypothetical protein